MEYLMRQWVPMWINPDRSDEAHPRDWTGQELDASILPRLQVADLDAAVDKCDGRAGLGWDQLHPRWLPGSRKERFLDGLRCWELSPGESSLG